MFSAAHARNLSQGKLARLIFTVFFFFRDSCPEMWYPAYMSNKCMSGKYVQFFFSLGSDREYCPGRSFPGKFSTQIMFMKHVRVVLLYNIPKKIMPGNMPKKSIPGKYAQKFLCPRNMPYSIMQGTNVLGYIPAKNARKSNTRNICQKWQFPANMSPR